MYIVKQIVENQNVWGWFLLQWAPGWILSPNRGWKEYKFWALDSSHSAGIHNNTTAITQYWFSAVIYTQNHQITPTSACCVCDSKHKQQFGELVVFLATGPEQVFLSRFTGLCGVRSHLWIHTHQWKTGKVPINICAFTRDTSSHSFLHLYNNGQYHPVCEEILWAWMIQICSDSCWARSESI